MGASAQGVVQIIVKAEDQTGGVFDKTFGRMQGLGKAAVIAGVGAAAAGVAAIGAVAYKGITEFMAFEDQLNEVFTLLPGISGQAMDQMKNQVLDASVEMGRLPEEVIPALYQSLSAGVPQGNVFEFLDTAHQAALGGVTELETAVDGISSVMNAYGSDVISATESSDLMFTAVRLGKTTFGELAGSLSNVTPIAAAMGVNFGDVTAALASMTSQGTPTAQATTQMRALLQELGTAGTEVAGVFEDVAGKSFLEFIDAGGNVGGAMQLLEQYATDTNTPIQDMFGNVRAGLGALQLTGKGAETFASNLAEMTNSAGATEGAFDTMNQGLNRTKEVLQAQLQTALIKIGDALAPIVRTVGEKLVDAFDKVQPYIQLVAEAFGEFFDVVGPLVDEFGLVQGVLYALEEALDSFLPEDVMAQIYEFNDIIVNKVVPAVQAFIDKVIEFGTPIWEAITSFVSFKDILIALGVFIAAAIIPAIISLIATLAPIIAVVLLVVGIIALLRNAWENNWGGIQEKTAAVIEFIRNIITTVMTAIQAFWAANGDEIKAKAEEIWNKIKTAIETAINTVSDVINTVVTAIQQFWAEHGDAILAKAQEIWNAIQSAIETVTGIISSVVEAFRSAFEGDWTAFGEKLRDAWDQAWNAIKTAVETIGPQILEFVGNLVADIVAWFTEKDWAQVGRDIIQGVAKGITAAASFIADAARNAAQAALDAAKGFLGIDSPSKVFAEVGINVGEGLAQGISSQVEDVAKSMSDMLEVVSPDQGAFAREFASIPLTREGGMEGVDRSRTTTNNFNLTLVGSGSPGEMERSFDLMKASVGDF